MSEIINLKNKIDDILKKKIKEFQLKNIAIDIVKNRACLKTQNRQHF